MSEIKQKCLRGKKKVERKIEEEEEEEGGAGAGAGGEG